MLATVASISSANRLRQYITDKYPVKIKIIQTPAQLTKEGCGYALKFDGGDKKIVAAAARELRINIRSFFDEVTENGKTEVTP